MAYTLKRGKRWEIIARIMPTGIRIISASGMIGPKDYKEAIGILSSHVDGAKLHGASHTMALQRDSCGVWHSHRQHIWGDMS